MLYLKTYCYSKHELPFIIANLEEGYEYIHRMYVYEYNYTHTGVKKSYEMESMLDKIPQKLRIKLVYRKVDISKHIKYAEHNEPLIHAWNEPVQRSYFFNDSVSLNENDIIIDMDADEIIYKKSYVPLIRELIRKRCPLSIKLNQFFFKQNYIWKDKVFSSPTIYTYGMVRNIQKKIGGLKIQHQRDLHQKTDRIYGCHMSWVMPVSYMVRKLNCYGHRKYKRFANESVLYKAIDEKKYVFDDNVKFKIEELHIQDERIPSNIQTFDLFSYLE